jgi:hypothetical protein
MNERQGTQDHSNEEARTKTAEAKRSPNDKSDTLFAPFRISSFGFGSSFEFRHYPSFITGYAT